MIEFKGELSKNCKKFLFKQQTSAQFFASLIVSLIASMIILLIAIPDNLNLLLLFVPLALLVGCSLLPPGKDSQKSFVPKRIYVDIEEGEIVHECEKLKRSHSIKSVKSITDYGEWYYFEFEFGDRDMYFICQKDLIARGTIEEFENLFQGKIIKK